MMRRPLPALLLLTATACSSDPAGVLEVEITGERTLQGLEEDVHVLRTEMNVPHIYAKNPLDLARVQGFVMARDRYVNMELFRRFGGGTLSELLGDLGLEIDAQTRGQGLRTIGDELWRDLPPPIKARFEAFAGGVNSYIDSVKIGRFPVPEELEIVAALIGVSDPSELMLPLDGQGVAYIAATIVGQLGYESTDVADAAIEERMATLFRSGPLADLRREGIYNDVWNAVAPVHAISQTSPGGSQTTAAGLSNRRIRTHKPAPAVTRATPLGGGLLDRVAERTERFQKLLGRPRGKDHGSNAWAVSSVGTGGKGSILANDGHLALSVPTLFYQMCSDTAYLGDDDLSLCGLHFPGSPLMAVGTNGDVAWGQTYLYGDITDWFSEQIELGSDGLPAQSRFGTEPRALVKTDETYRVLAGDGDFDEVTWPRWQTFDERWLVSIEGEVITATTAALGDRPVVLMQGEYIVPGDMDGDGVVSGISFDWTAFDFGDSLTAFEGFTRAKNVAEFAEQTRKFVGLAQNIVASDGDGDILYTGYTGLPCRDDLARTDAGWVEGDNPTRLLDGTRHGGFDARDGACVIPFEVGPTITSPAAGFVHTANHDLLGYGFDDDLSNDPQYLGGPYALGYRAQAIDSTLSTIVSGKNADIDSTAKLQGRHVSPLGTEYTPRVLESIARAKALVGQATMSEADQRLLALYQSMPGPIDESQSRLQTWLTDGAQAMSGVETFYNKPDAQELKDAVGAMLFNAWLRHMIEATFDDEGIDFVIASFPDRIIFRTLNKMFEGRGSDNPRGLASWNPATGESAFFDVRDTPEIETSHEIVLTALVRTLEQLSGPPGRSDTSGGFGTADMDKWLWGLRHQVRIDSLLAQVGSTNPEIALLGARFSLTTSNLPLAPDLDRDDPRQRITRFPRNGDFFTVDAAGPSMLENRWYTYDTGPVMRMVIALDDGKVTGQNILPGGQSGAVDDPNFADQAALWLENRTVPIRYEAEAVVEGSSGHELYKPVK